MADKIISDVKLQFQSGDHPNQTDFEDLIDSAVALSNATDDSGKLDPRKVSVEDTGFTDLQDKLDSIDSTIANLTSDDIASTVNTGSVTDEVNRIDTRIDNLTADQIATLTTGESVQDKITTLEPIVLSNESRLDNLSTDDVVDNRTTGGNSLSTTLNNIEFRGQAVANWDETITYSENQIINYSGILYRSITDPNLNNQPDISTSDWEYAIAITSFNIVGSWNATTNNPDLADFGTGVQAGDSWIVSVAGTTNLGGYTDWAAKDIAFWDGSQWIKIDNSNVGNVIGPASSEDNVIATFNGLTGTLLKQSKVAITNNTRIQSLDKATATDNITLATGDPTSGNSGNLTISTANSIDADAGGILISAGIGAINSGFINISSNKSINLSAPVDETTLGAQPTGAVPLAIATTGYVDSAVPAGAVNKKYCIIKSASSDAGNITGTGAVSDWSVAPGPYTATIEHGLTLTDGDEAIVQCWISGTQVIPLSIDATSSTIITITSSVNSDMRVVIIG